MLKSYLSKLTALALLIGMSFGAFAQNVTITSPASIAGDYLSKHAAFGGWLNGEAADLVLADDGTGVSNGCTITNDMAGKIALIDRGVCGFAIKAINAQNAGAIGVIICNNNPAIPDSTIVMGGFDCNITIPSVMLSLNVCNAIKVELASGTVSATFPTNYPGIGNGIEAEIALPGAGTYTATTLTGGASIFTDATNIQVYSIVAPITGVMNVNSCLGGADTRLTVFNNVCRGEPLATAILGQNDDACEFEAGGDLWASNLDVIVEAGETYLIVWDDAWDDTGFDFEVSFGNFPSSNVTFTVDMKDETVAPDGVKISINGGASANMTDLGGGIWSYTGSFTANDVLSYRFQNGAGNDETSPDIAGCRSVTVGLADVTLALVCYNSCTICPPDAVCPLWVDENFDNYNLGGISAQSPIWTPWTTGSVPEDAAVSNAQAFSGTQSLLISAANADDQLLLLGDRTSGNYILRWKMFVPTGSSAYYNIQKIQGTPGATGGFAMEATFNAPGTGTISAGATNSATFNYPQNVWFDVVHWVDIDNNRITLLINGNSVQSWPFNWQANAQTGINQLGSIDFFGNTGNLYYVDNVQLKQIDACPADALICDGFDGYNNGSLGPQSPWWTTWTLSPGGVDDGLVSSEQFLSCEQSMKIANANGDDVILLLGNRPTGNYLLSWNMYVPTGFGAYYNVQKDTDKLPNPVTADFSLQVDMLPSGSATVDAGGAAAFTFTYPHDTWFNVAHLYDLDNNTASLWIDGVQLFSFKPSWDIFTQTPNGVIKLGGVDFYGNTNNLYYVDDVLLLALPAAPGNICAGAINLNPYLGGGIGTTVSTPLYDNTGNTTTASDPATGWDCFGEPDGGGATPELNNTVWFTFVGDGETYFIETGQCGATNYIEDGDTQMAIYSGDCGNLTPVACNEDSPNAVAGNFIAGLELATTPGTVYYMMIDGFNLFGTTLSGGQFCINFSQLTGIPVVDVTFRVDMSKESSVNAAGVRLAGSFNGWSDKVMTNVGNGIWETVIQGIPVGSTIQYKFKNGPNGWENNDDLQDCGVDDGNGSFNRQNVIGNTNQTLPTVCFNWCVTCALVDANESLFAKSVGMNPNPAGDFVNLTYNFESLTNLNIRLVNSLGQVLVERNLDSATTGSERLNIASMPSGAYTVVFSNGQQAVAKRLIIQ